MAAYFIHNSKTETDVIIMPDMQCSFPVDAERMEAYIAVSPKFGAWSGDACGVVDPEDFGTVVATREEGGDVCILNEDIWKERMKYYLGDPPHQK